MSTSTKKSKDRQAVLNMWAKLNPAQIAGLSATEKAELAAAQAAQTAAITKRLPKK